jgi:hypothetical protein
MCIVKSAVAEKIVIPVNATVTIQSKMDKQVSLPPCFGITEHYEKSILPAGVEETPILIRFN